MPAQNPTTSSGNNESSPNIDVTSPYTPRRPAPIVSLSINHPIGTALRKIKNFLTHKQTLFSTTFTIKITPIVAMVSLLGVAALFGGGVTTAFQFGKTVGQKFLTSTLSPTPGTMRSPASPAVTIVSVPKAGTIKATYQLPAVSPILTPEVGKNQQNVNTSGVSENSGQIASSSTISGSDSGQARMTNPNPTPTPQPVLHYILVSKSGSINYLVAGSSIYLQNYLGLRVLVTGNFDSSKNTLSIAKATDIEILQ